MNLNYYVYSPDGLKTKRENCLDYLVKRFDKIVLKSRHEGKKLGALIIELNNERYLIELIKG